MPVVSESQLQDEKVETHKTNSGNYLSHYGKECDIYREGRLFYFKPERRLSPDETMPKTNTTRSVTPRTTKYGTNYVQRTERRLRDYEAEQCDAVLRKAREQLDAPYDSSNFATIDVARDGRVLRNELLRTDEPLRTDSDFTQQLRYDGTPPEQHDDFDDVPELEDPEATTKYVHNHN